MTARLRPGRTFSGIGQNLEHPSTRIVTIGLLVTAGILLTVLIYWLVLLAQLPSVSEIREAAFDRPSVVYSSDGEQLTSYGDKHQTWLPLEQISRAVPEALIATEDHRYYSHWGVDARRTAGAVIQTVRGNRQGGSTITMQLARNAFPDLTEDSGASRKIKEWVTAVRLEGVYGKNDILEMYLNTVPFMYNAFGIEAAARTYFQKSAGALRVDEAAVLVGMLKGTVYYNPVRNPDRAHERRNVVLQQMVEHGYLTVADYRSVEKQPTPIFFRRPSRSDQIAPHFTEYVRQQLEEWAEEHEYDLTTDGLHIYTTIDSRLQEAAREAVSEVTDDLQAVADVEWSEESTRINSSDASAYRARRRDIVPFSYFWSTHQELLPKLIEQSDRYQRLIDAGVASSEALRGLAENAAFVDSLKAARQRLEAGLAAIDPRTGHAVAWVGGRDFEENQYDHVAAAKRQPGSAFKPFVYAAALDNGYAPGDRLRDEVITYTDPQTGRTWRPENVGSASGGMITLRDALAHSVNTVTAQLVVEIGPEQVVRYAHRMGIESELDSYPSIGLGTSEVSLLELTSAYVTLENEGRFRAPIVVTRVEDRNGRVLATFDSQEREAISRSTAQQVRDMLRGVTDYGTGTRIRHEFGVDGDIAGKTGTSQEGADGWFVLMRPDLVTGAWVGFDAPAIAFRSDFWGQGSHTALPIVGSFYRRLMQIGAVPVHETRH